MNFSTIGSDAISRCLDFSSLTLRNTEDYVPYIRQFLQDHSFPADAGELNKTQIIAEMDKFALEDGVLYRKVKEGIITPYIDFQFRGDLMQRMHDQYGHLSCASPRIASMVPTMEKDLCQFIAACPNCQIYQLIIYLFVKPHYTRLQAYLGASLSIYAPKLSSGISKEFSCRRDRI